MSKRLSILVLLFLLTCSSTTIKVFAQGIFTHYNFEGFAQVSKIVQDSSGYLWIQATGNLGRFDGYNVITYTDSSGNRLVSDELSVDPSGQLWVKDYTSTRLHCYKKSKDAFTTYEPDIDEASIIALGFEKNGSVWLGTQEGIFLFDPKENTTKQFFNPNGDSVQRSRNNLILDIREYPDHLLLGTSLGLWRFDKEKKTFSRPFANIYKTTFHSEEAIHRIFPGKDHYWFYLPTSLIKTDLDFNIVQQFDFPENFLASGVVDVDRDNKSGVLWISSYGSGLIAYDPSTEKVIQYLNNPSDKFSLVSDILMPVLVDRNQNIWVGTYSNGFEQLKKQSLRFYNHSLSEGLAPGYPQVLSTHGKTFILLEAKKDGLWISPFSGNPDAIQFKRFETQPSMVGVGTTLSMLGKNFWWIGTWDKGLVGVPLNPKTLYPQSGPLTWYRHDSKNPNTIDGNSAGPWLEDSEENLWISSPRNILNKINVSLRYGQEGSVTRYVHNSLDSNSLSPGAIWSVVPEDGNALWVLTDHALDHFKDGPFHHIYKSPSESVQNFCFQIASDGTLLIGSTDGLVLGIKENGVYRFTEAAPLKGVIVYSVLEDKKGRLWVSGENGIFCYDRKDQSLFQFKEDDGLSSNEFSANASAQTPDGYLIFTAANAITIFDPLSFKVSLAKPPLTITQLKVNNKPARISNFDSVDRRENFTVPQHVSVLQELVLDYTHNIFSLEFAALDLTSPQKNLYKYKLEGFDPDWVQTDWKNRTATYTNLDPGSYLFKAKATNHNGIWSDQETTLSVTVLPPPWRTWWAYTGYSLFVVGLLLGARRTIVQRERLKANLQLAKVEQEKEHIELEKAQEVDRVKTSFFTNISHEFRTPLTLIKGPVQNIIEQFGSGQKEIDKQKVVDQLKLVERNSDLLLRLINQLLDLAKLESGSLKVEKTEGEISGFVSAIASSFSSFASQKNISVNISVPTDRHHVLFDKDKLETILINLINNAIKFTPAGGSVTVSVDLTPGPSLEERGASPLRQGEKNKEQNLQSIATPLSSGEGVRGFGAMAGVRLTVKDTGIGIPADQQTKIFERFHQVSEAHKEVGTGIGLSLVKELINLMGGSIEVKSKPGEGSEFVVVLPIEIATSYMLQAASLENVKVETESTKQEQTASSSKLVASSQNEEDQNKPHVLVVEDNTDLRHFIIDSLGNEFYFLEAENGKIGLEVATREVPDLIISDVMMPEMDGITMATKIKKDIHTSHIPLILLTAKSTEDSKLSGLQSGADDYLTKPFNKNELLLKVRNGVNRQQKLREKLRAELMSTAPKVEVLSEDEQFLNSVKEKILERLSDEQLSVESLAEDMGMSRVQLYRKISGLTDISVNELIRKLRLQRAAQLISQNWGPVSQVAYEVGFSNLSYFSKVFKEEFGVLPSEYKKS